MNESPELKDRRKSTRRQKHAHAEIKPTDNGGEFESVQLMNVSEGGARFVCSRSFDVGQNAILRLGNQERRIVVHECKQLFNGYAIRSEFLPADD